jgi:glycosyltransferase involved in cell wall biosynthesis
MKKKIVICSNAYPPNFIGGAELIAHNQAKTLKKLGHDVVVFTGDTQVQVFGKRHSLRRDTYDGLTVYRIYLTPQDYQSDFINFTHKKVEEHFKKLLDSFSPDIVHFHNIIGLSVGLIHIAKHKGIKTILTVHDHWGFCHKNTILKSSEEICHDYRCAECMSIIPDEDCKNIPIRMRKDFIAIQLSDVDAFISPSQYLADAYIRAGIPKEKFNVIWYGINVQQFAHISKTPMNRRIRFTFVGYFGRHKGIHILLNALPFVGNYDHFEVNLVGDGELMANLKQQVKAMGLNNLVKFWGKSNNIEKAYRETDIFILPSIWPENQPVTITEAMASRLPVIASDAGGIPELVKDGKTGYLFEVGNAKDLAQKMSEFILHPDRIKTFGENGYKEIINNTFENQSDKILQVYNEKVLDQVKQPREEMLIACIGKRVNPQCAQTMNSFLNEGQQCIFRFVMSDWVQEDQFRMLKLLWVVDEEINQKDIIIGLMNKLPLLVPEVMRS